MKEGCEETRAILDAWVERGEVDGDELHALLRHVAVCDACRLRYRAVLPLVRRDMGDTGVFPAEEAAVPAGLAEAVMERIESPTTRYPARSAGRRKARTVRLAGLAAAAMVLVVAGLLFYGFGSQGSQNEVVVHFVLDAPGATRVALAGSFTDWSPDKLLLKHDPGTSRWEISVPLERGRTYLYNFVINGKTWIPDPGTEVQISDGFGGESSLIQL